MQSENGFKALMKLTQDKTGAVTGAGSLGICMMDEVNDKFTYAIGVEKPAAKAAPAGFEVIHIPTATWAVFESIGPMPKAIQTVTVKIFKEWFPSTGYEHAAIPELEVYLPGNPDNQDYHCQVWIPIIKKENSKLITGRAGKWDSRPLFLFRLLFPEIFLPLGNFFPFLLLFKLRKIIFPGFEMLHFPLEFPEILQAPDTQRA